MKNGRNAFLRCNTVFTAPVFGWFVPSIVGLVLGILYSVAVKPSKN